jgi:hypothetical protein
MHRINQASASKNAEGPAGNGATAIALHSHLHPVKSKPMSGWRTERFAGADDQRAVHPTHRR